MLPVKQPQAQDDLSHMMDDISTRLPKQEILYASWIDTPIDPMMAIANDDKLYLFDFDEQSRLERAIGRLKKKCNIAITPGRTAITERLEQELFAYFKGTLSEFKTPLHLEGTSFQKEAWSALTHIPYGKTKSYLEQATSLGKPKSYRAVANANGSNPIAIIIPCHRIINHNGELGGYGGGLTRKKWLLDHERKHARPL